MKGKLKIFNKLDLRNIKRSSIEICHIIKKELKSQFTNPSAYIVIAVFLVILEFLFFTSLLNIRLVTVRPLLDNIPWLFIFLIPAITMATFAQEKKEGTIEFYLTQPITELQLLIGKFISNFLFITIAVLLTLPAVISVASFGSIDWGQITGQYIAILFLAFSLTALGTYVSTLVQNQISSFLLAVLGSFFLVIIGFELVTQSVPLGIAEVLGKISLFSHYGTMSRGVIDIRDAIYFLSLGAIFLTASYLPLIKGKFAKKDKIYSTMTAGVILLIAMSISIAILGEQIPGRIDLTQSKIYSLSDTTKEIIGNSPDLINITLYASSQLPPQYQPAYRDVRDMLSDYQTFGKGNVQVSYKYPDKSEEIETEAMSMGVTPVQFNLRTNEEYQVKKGYLGIVISYLDKTEVISFVEDTSSFEYQLTSLISKLTKEKRNTIVFLDNAVGNKLSESYQFLSQELGKQFEVTTVTLDEENNALPEKTSVLVLPGVNEELTDSAKKTIKEFLNNGGSVYALIDTLNIDPQMLSVTENENSLKELFEEYGITVTTEMLFDLKYNEIVSIGSGRQQFLINYPFWVKVFPKGETSITAGIDTVGLRWTSSILVKEELPENMQAQQLLISSDYSGVQKSGAYNIDPSNQIEPNSEDLSSKTIAASVIIKIDEEKSARLIVVGDSDLLTDDSVQANQNNLLFGLNSIEWLAQEISLSEIRQKDRSLSPLVFESDWGEPTLKYGNILGALFGVSIVGAIVMIRRRRKSKLEYEN